MKRSIRKFALLLVLVLVGTRALRAQAPVGPMAPRPGQAVQHVPADAQATLKVRVALVNLPVTVRNAKGDMVHDLEAKDFRITDNGADRGLCISIWVAIRFLSWC